MPEKEKKLTPAMKQFHHFKKKYPDAILFFRMGDFYETFYEDARICSKVLGLTLTSRSKADNPIPLAGVPFHAVDGYLKKMIQAGYKVAVCEQVEDAKKAKGVVKRDVVRIVTPGTLTDDMLLDSKENNYLCAINLGTSDKTAISYVDISTGHFFAQKIEFVDLIDELLRLGPAECLLADTRGELFDNETKKISSQITQLTNAVVTLRPPWYFDPWQAKQRLLKHFQTSTLEGFGILDSEAVIAPAGAIIEYLDETQKVTLNHIQSIQLVNRSKHLEIDTTSLKSLEVICTIRSQTRKGSLLQTLDNTVTAPGARMFRNWICMPLKDKDAIELRHDAVEELIENNAPAENIRQLLSSIADIERIAARVATFRAGPRDLLALAATLKTIPELRNALTAFEADILKKLSVNCDSMDELAELLTNAIEPQCPTHLRQGGVIREGYDAELDRLTGLWRDGKKWLTEYQELQVQKTGIPKLRIGFNKVFGYYIEVSHAAASKVPDNYIRKQTIKNAERYITEELKNYETQVLTAQDRAIELEVNLFDKLIRKTAEYTGRMQKIASVLATADCLAALANVAAEHNYVRPEMTSDRRLEITDGKHPVLAELLGSQFVPNDLVAGNAESDCIIITGPNMSGKSTFIRQAALLVILAQAGSFVPAKSARIGIVDRIFTRVGASDELARGQSTFMVEMTETANILNNATDRSLVILDEVGRGTSTYDGLSLAWAITEHIATKIKCRTLFATHYHELTELAELFKNIRNCNVAVREWMDEVIFLHKIVPGGTDKSYGIHVAKIAGIPKKVIERSKEILSELENTFAREAAGENLAKNKTRQPDENLLFVQKHKTVLDKLAATDVNNLTPLQAMNLLNKIKNEIKQGS
jgi:DNA mismatch repair protein MutS